MGNNMLLLSKTIRQILATYVNNSNKKTRTLHVHLPFQPYNYYMFKYLLKRFGFEVKLNLNVPLNFCFMSLLMDHPVLSKRKVKGQYQIIFFTTYYTSVLFNYQSQRTVHMQWRAYQTMYAYMYTCIWMACCQNGPFGTFGTFGLSNVDKAFYLNVFKKKFIHKTCT